MRKRVHKPPNINNFYPRKFKFHIPELFLAQSSLALLVVPSFVIRPLYSEKVKFAQPKASKQTKVPKVRKLSNAPFGTFTKISLPAAQTVGKIVNYLCRYIHLDRLQKSATAYMERTTTLLPLDDLQHKRYRQIPQHRVQVLRADP